MPEDFAKLSGHAKDLNNQLRMTNTQMNNLENRSGAIAENLAASGRMSGAFSGMLIPQGTIDDINGQFDDLGADAAKLLEDSLAVDFDFSALGEQFADLSLGDLTPEKMAELQAAADGLNIDLNAELIALMDMMTGKSDLDKLDDILTYTFETDEELARFQRMIGLEGEFVGKDLDTGYLTYEFPINESLQNFYDLIGGAYVTDSEGLDGYLDLSFETPDELARFQDLLMMTGDFKDSDFDIKDGTTLLINAERGTELNEFMLLMNGNSGYILLYKTTKHQID
jgi:tetrahydromethanopterin S-methyltransferase subunit B